MKHGRPPHPIPENFEEVFIQFGWDAKDVLGMDTPRFKRTVTEAGGEDLKRRRKNYVLGRRLSSLKVGARGL